MVELARRYVVMPLATDAPFDPADPDGVFVLKPWKDPAALRALRAYRDSCFPELSRDLDAWISAIEAGPTVRGDVGRRNEPFARMASVSSAIAIEPPAPMSKPPRPSAPVKSAATKTVTTATAVTKPSTRRTVAKKPAAAVKTSKSRTSVSGSAQPSGAAKQGAARRPLPRKQVKKRRR